MRIPAKDMRRVLPTSSKPVGSKRRYLVMRIDKDSAKIEEMTNCLPLLCVMNIKIAKTTTMIMISTNMGILSHN